MSQDQTNNCNRDIPTIFVSLLSPPFLKLLVILDFVEKNELSNYVQQAKNPKWCHKHYLPLVQRI